MPNVSIVTNQLHTIGESLIRVSNLAAHIGTEIRSLQFNLTKAVSDLQGLEKNEEQEPLLSDEWLTTEEVQKLHALNTTRQCVMVNWRRLERERQEIIDRARARQAGEQDGGQNNDD